MRRDPLAAHPAHIVAYSHEFLAAAADELKVRLPGSAIEQKMDSRIIALRELDQG